MIKMVGIAVAFCLLTAAIATADPAGPAAAREATPSDVSFTVAIDHSAQGALGTVHGVATLTNTCGQPVKFMYGGRTFVWQIVDPGGAVVFDDSVGRAVPMFVMIRVLQPGKSLTVTRDVTLTRQDGSPLPAGHYALKATMNGLNLKAHADFTVGG
jgi:hypothetical protein